MYGVVDALGVLTDGHLTLGTLVVVAADLLETRRTNGRRVGRRRDDDGVFDDDHLVGADVPASNQPPGNVIISINKFHN